MFFYRKSSKLIFLAIGAIILLLFFHYLGILRPIENLASSIVRPVFGSVYSASNWIGKNYLDFKVKQELIDENNDLKVQLLNLQKDKSKWFIEQEENEFLREQLRFVQELDYNFEIARVIGKSLDNIQNTIILDKGEKQGIALGQPVLANNQVLIGKIIKVNKNSSIVLLINDDLSKVAVKIQNKTKTMGEVQGEFGLGVKMKLIPQTEKIEQGDIIVTSGLEEKIPAGLLIGQVQTVKAEPEELFQEASIQPLADLNRITLVNIIKDYQYND